MDTLYTEVDLHRIEKVIQKAKIVAREYGDITGKPLGITGEVSEFEAARILGLRLSAARQAGYDAVSQDGDSVKKIQIKGRRLVNKSRLSQRVGRIRLDHEWDSVVLVLLDEDYEPFEIYEAERSDIKNALDAPGSKARNERGSLSISKFKSMSKLLWERK